jgi:predicted MPP superfamily phosphohydrolase
MAIVIYNLLMAVVDLAAWLLIRARPSVGRWLAVGLGAASCAVVAAVPLAADHFHFIQMLCYGVFAHGALMSLLSAWWLRRTARWLAAVCGLAAVGLWLTAFDAFVIEPTCLQIGRYEIVSEKLSRPLKVVVVADLQTDCLGDYERETLRLALAEKPDLLLFAGDYVQVWDAERCAPLQAEINAFLRELGATAPRGVFAVCGNVDGWRWEEIFAGLGAQAVTATQTYELDDLLLTCLSLEDSASTGLTISNRQPQKFHIVLGHKPNFALGQIEGDLLLAGHTHGGQVRLPLVGPLITHARVPRAWAAGLTELGGGRWLLVSRGIGMEREFAPRMRFCCRPELVVIELRPQAKP